MSRGRGALTAPLAVTLAATLLASVSFAAAHASDGDWTARLGPAVAQALAAKGIGAADAPGCAISVTGPAGAAFEAAYGAADLEQATPFSVATISETGSVAKQITAAEVLLLAEDGRLALGDDVRRYLPELPDYGAPVRIYDLLHQTSGVREWATLAALRGAPRFYRKVYRLADLLRLVAGERQLNFAPGARYEYSNSNYGLLTLVVERVSGESAQAFAARRIFGPLGMDHTRWRDDLRRLTPGRAQAYRRTASGYALYPPLEEVYGHGALLTTVADLQAWNAALLSGRLSTYVTREVLSPGRLRDGATRAYGAGVVLTRYRGHRVVRHGGTTAGYTAQLWGFPDDGVSIALLCNLQAGDMGEIAAAAADAALDLPRETPPPTAAAARTPFETGYYRSASGEMIVLSGHGVTTRADVFNRKGPGVLVSEGTGGYGTLETPGLRLQAAGRRAIYAALDGHDPTLFRRVAAAPPTVSPVGRFVSPELGVSYVVERANNGYRMALADPAADDPIWFDLERLTGDSYLARLHTESGYIRDDFFVQMSARGFALSSVMGLQAVDGLRFRRLAGPRR